MSTTEYIQIIIGIGQIIAVAIIPIIVWVLGIKYQNRKAKKDAQLRVFLTLMADRKSTPITKEWVDALNTIDVVFQENKKVRHAWREYLAYIIHSGFISGYQNRYGDNLKPPTNVYHRMTA